MAESDCWTDVEEIVSVVIISRVFLVIGLLLATKLDLIIGIDVWVRISIGVYGEVDINVDLKQFENLFDVLHAPFSVGHASDGSGGALGDHLNGEL